MQIARVSSFLSICATPTDADRDAILAPLAAFNADNGYPADPRPVAILPRDEAGVTTRK
jgi:hypothetical protein